jgi:hypothetical protein
MFDLQHGEKKRSQGIVKMQLPDPGYADTDGS